MDDSCMVEDADEEEVPVELNTMNHPHSLEVLKDKLTVKYVGKGNHAHDVGSIQANRACPKKRMIYYYEVTLLDTGQRGCIAVGLADKHFLLNRQPGWEANSFAYHGDDGRKYNDSERGESYGPPCSSGDVMGCGIHFHNQEIFFTKNGKNLGPAFKKDLQDMDLYPTLGLHSPGEMVSFNFGKKPFRFDIHTLINAEREKKMREVSQIPIHVGDMTTIVCEYLLHYGYEDTLLSFDQSAVQQRPELSSSLAQRKRLRRLVLDGDVLAAIQATDELYPGLLQENSSVKFQLHCQHFIELVRQSRVADAVSFAQQELAKYRESEDNPFLQEVVALLAYQDPANSPLTHLMQSGQRDSVADALNRAILEKHEASSSCSLERLLKQVVGTHWMLREQRGCKGEVFKLPT